MERINIELLKYRGNKSTLFTGRPQGEKAREELKLNKLDKSENIYTLIIPKGTTSFNPSFYLGLLFNSIEYLGFNKFDKKYFFEYEEKDNQAIIDVLNKNIDDARRYALNTINDNSSFKNLFKK